MDEIESGQDILRDYSSEPLGTELTLLHDIQNEIKFINRKYLKPDIVVSTDEDEIRVNFVNSGGVLGSKIYSNGCVFRNYTGDVVGILLLDLSIPGHPNVIKCAHSMMDENDGWFDSYLTLEEARKEEIVIKASVKVCNDSVPFPESLINDTKLYNADELLFYFYNVDKDYQTFCFYSKYTDSEDFRSYSNEFYAKGLDIARRILDTRTYKSYLDMMETMSKHFSQSQTMHDMEKEIVVPFKITSSILEQCKDYAADKQFKQNKNMFCIQNMDSITFSNRPEHNLSDSGSRTKFDTDAVRELGGKGRCDLIPSSAWELLCTIENEGFDTLPNSYTGIFLLIEDFLETKNVTFIEHAIQLAFKEIANRDEKEFNSPKEIVAYGLLDISKQFEEGAKKYAERNWEQGLPFYTYVDSALRHSLKYIIGMIDEPHLRAAAWNLICLYHTIKTNPDWAEGYTFPVK